MNQNYFNKIALSLGRKIAIWICSLYSGYEFLFLKKRGVGSLNSPILIDNIAEKLNTLVMKEIIDSSPFQKIHIVDEYQLNNFIKKIFDENFRQKIESITGFKYSIDFFVFNQNFHIEKNNQDNPIYANHWHIDSTFTLNALKIFIPMGEISDRNGPLNYIDSKYSKKLIANNFQRLIDLPSDYQDCIGTVCGKKGDVFLVNPRTMLHKAGVPQYGFNRLQLMVQLNPSKKWKYNKDIFPRQYKVEVNLPIIKNFFSSYHNF